MAKRKSKSSKRSKQNERSIYRVDNTQNHTHGWLVTFQRRGRIWRKLFSDGPCGGRTKSRKAALAYRDALAAKYPRRARWELANIKRKNNTSGFVGVSRHAVFEPKNGHALTNWVWIARWAPEPWQQKMVKFSVAKYGDKGALKRALEARRQGLSAIKRLERKS